MGLARPAVEGAVPGVGLLDEAATGTGERQATADTHHHAPLRARGQEPGRAELVVVVTAAPYSAPLRAGQ